MGTTVSQDTESLAESADGMWEDLVDALPRLGVAVATLVAGYLIARVLRWGLCRYWTKRDRTESYARVMSKLVSWVALLGFVLAAATVAFPSVKPVDLLAGLGFFSIAIGFAFQDVLENSLSGVLLLFRQPFQSGDQIEVQGMTGTVEGITIRETRITTYDGRLVIIPNRDVYKNVIVVQTANVTRRVDVTVGVAYESDLEQACTVIVDALRNVDGIDAQREPEAFVRELAASTVNIQARFWAPSAQHDVVVATSRAITEVKGALDDAGIELPCEIIALQATESFAGALREDSITPGGSLAG